MVGLYLDACHPPWFWYTPFHSLKGKQMSKAYDKRFELADQMADELLELVKEKGKQYGMPGHDEAGLSYVVGYMRSVLQSVAAQSPAAMERLELSVRAARYKS
jgi:hypothetical protein